MIPCNHSDAWLVSGVRQTYLRILGNRNVAVRIVNSENVQSFHDVREFLDKAPRNGQIAINHRGLSIDILMEDRNSPNTVFYFHPALVKTVKTIPLFNGRNIAKEVDANSVFIADPSLALSDSLNLAWYAGNKFQDDLQSVLMRIIDSIAKSLNSRQVVFFGASGGGFASMYYSSYFPNSVAVAMNPQTKIQNYLARQVYRYATLAWGTSEKDYDPMNKIPALTDLTAIYRQPVANTVFYLQNTQDDSHFQRQWEPFRMTLHPSNYVVKWFEPWGNGHVAAPKSTLLSAINAACRTSRSSEHSVVDYKLALEL